MIDFEIAAREMARVWIQEEMREHISANAVPAKELDALLDALGIIFLALTLYPPDQICEAHEEYVASQIRRKRTDPGHQGPLAAFVKEAVKHASALGASPAAAVFAAKLATFKTK